MLPTLVPADARFLRGDVLTLYGRAHFDAFGERAAAHLADSVFLIRTKTFFDFNLRLGVRSFMLLRPK
jgi:hypothetical protein